MYCIKCTFYDNAHIDVMQYGYYTGTLKQWGRELSVIPAIYLYEIKIYSTYNRAVQGMKALNNKLADGELEIVKFNDINPIEIWR